MSLSTASESETTPLFLRLGPTDIDGDTKWQASYQQHPEGMGL